MFDPYFVQNNYGYEFPNSSNIIFSNGNDDPFTAGAWRNKTTNEGSLYSLINKNGAEMYDFLASNKNDTKYVKNVRNKEKFVLYKNFLIFIFKLKNAYCFLDSTI
jgi:hypothetical protein